ncbi:MAG: C40 family peptidase [Gaiella sp.]|nr:C40 family peptidase [Gaiella sp.]
MRPRLAIPVIACAAVLAVAGSTADADAVAPIRGLRLESPVAFRLPARPVRLPLGERAARLARAQLGVRYVWGGASPGGFDCSGLVMWVYARLGISLPHNAAALYGSGRPVPLRAMRPGDLVFFPGLGHVGIYVGQGRMIHAPQSGRRVEVEALDARSYPPVGARRVAAS